MTVKNLAALDNALTNLASVMTADSLANDSGPTWSCGEADALAAVLIASGHRDAALTWLNGHSVADTDEPEYDFHGEGVDLNQYLSDLEEGLS